MTKTVPLTADKANVECFSCGARHFRRDKYTGQVCNRKRTPEEKKESTQAHQKQQQEFSQEIEHNGSVAKQLKFSDSPNPAKQSANQSPSATTEDLQTLLQRSL